MTTPTTGRRPTDSELAPNLVLESRDRRYEPGRRIRLIEPAGPTGPGCNPHWICETIANPCRPSRVGTITPIRQAVLQQRWMIPADESAGAPS